MTRQTVGKLSSDLLLKNSEEVHVLDQTNEQLTDYEKNLFETVDTCLTKYFGNFYIVVLTKKERLMQNVIRNYFLGRKTCPTPEYDQVVYTYDRPSDSLDFLWVVPSKDTCELFKNNMLRIDHKEKELLGYVLDFYDGTLLNKSKKLNGEKQDTIELA
jgi:hypothetical protein